MSDFPARVGNVILRVHVVLHRNRGAGLDLNIRKSLFNML